MTEDKRYSLAPSTVRFLEKSDKFKSRLFLKIYLEGDNLPAEIRQFRNAVEDKLKEFKEVAGENIEYEFIDPYEGTKQEQQELFQQLFAKGKGILPMDIVYSKDGEQRQILLWPGATITYGGSTVQTIQLLPGSRTGQPFHINDLTQVIQNSINNLEYMLISSLRRVIREKKPTIAFIHGHGELKFQETQRIRALMSPYYNIEDITLNDSIHALDNAQGVIIARPRTPYTFKDLYIIDQFLMKGGRLMCFLDRLHFSEDTLKKTGMTHTMRYRKLGVEGMLFDYGLKINDNFVMDVNSIPIRIPTAKQALIPWFYYVLGTPTSHPISRNVEPVLLKYTHEIQFVGNNDSIALSPVLTSSTNSAVSGLAPLLNLSLYKNYGKNPVLAPDPESESNKRCLVGLSEGFYKSHFRNRIVDEFAKNPDAHFLEKSVREGKVLLVGNGRWIMNKYDSMLDPVINEWRYRPDPINDLQFDRDLVEMKIPHFFGNQEFFQNLVDYMMGDNSVLDIRSRQIEINRIDKEKVKAKSNFYRILNIGIPILFVIILAFVFAYFRKKKYTQN